jgi:hypothetical protein
MKSLFNNFRLRDKPDPRVCAWRRLHACRGGEQEEPPWSEAENELSAHAPDGS